MAPGYAWGNFELRAKVLQFNLSGRHIDMGVNPFFDLGAITRKYRLHEQRNALPADGEPILYQEAPGKLFASAGIGGKIHMDTNFVLSIEIGKGFNPQLSDLTVSMSTTYTF